MCLSCITYHLIHTSKLTAACIHRQVLRGVLAAAAAAGSGADAAVQLAVLHCLASALGAPDAGAAVQQLAQEQPPEQHAVAPDASPGSSPGDMLLQEALQRPAVQRRDPAAGRAVEGLQPVLHVRSDAAAWRAPAPGGDTAAGTDLKPAPASKPQPTSSLADLLLSTACGERVSV